MSQTVDGSVPVTTVLGRVIEFNGSEVLITREETADGHEEYHLEWQGETDVPPADVRTTLDKLLIGCPTCKQNQYAKFEDGEYVCPCGYSNELNVATLLSP